MRQDFAQNWMLPESGDDFMFEYLNFYLEDVSNKVG